MGCLRIYLAIVVVFGHTIGQISIGSSYAVEIFFLISGYLIASVLDRGAYKNYTSYLASRLLRIFPLYWLILVITLLYRTITIMIPKLQSIDSSNFVAAYQNATGPLLSILFLSNVFIVLQDLILFINTDGTNYGLVGFSENPKLTSLQPGLIVPQAWSLSLEIYFYILAPFLFRRKKLLFLILGISISSMIIMAVNNLSNSDPWSYRFFPSELMLFVFGMLAFRVSRYVSISSYFKPLLTSYCIFLVAFGFLGFNQLLLKLVLVMLTIILLPDLAKVNQSSKIDAFLGKLSFPVYLIHFLVIQIVTSLQELLFSRSNSYLTCLVTLVLSIVFSILVNRFFLDPIDMYRTRFKSKA